MGLQTGLIKRTTAVSNVKKAVTFTPATGLTINPHEITIVNTDTVAHIVDFFNGTGGATVLFTMIVPSDGVTGGEADYYEDNEISSFVQNMSTATALAAASRDAVGGAGLEFNVRAGRL